MLKSRWKSFISWIIQKDIAGLSTGTAQRHSYILPLGKISEYRTARQKYFWPLPFRSFGKSNPGVFSSWPLSQYSTTAPTTFVDRRELD